VLTFRFYNLLFSESSKKQLKISAFAGIELFLKQDTHFSNKVTSWAKQTRIPTCRAATKVKG
jgi:hypothetical protein